MRLFNPDFVTNQEIQIGKIDFHVVADIDFYDDGNVHSIVIKDDVSFRFRGAYLHDKKLYREQLWQRGNICPVETCDFLKVAL